MKKKNELTDYLEISEKAIGQIYPVIKDAKGNIIDGVHRKRTKPDWKEVTLPIEDDLESLKMRVHLNLFRREITRVEKERWVSSARQMLRRKGSERPTQKEIAEALGMSREWVKKYDTGPDTYHKTQRLVRCTNVCDLVRLLEEFSTAIKSECDVNSCEADCPLYEKVCKPFEETLIKLREALGLKRE